MNDFVLCTKIVEFHSVIELIAEYSTFFVSLSVQMPVWTSAVAQGAKFLTQEARDLIFIWSISQFFQDRSWCPW